MQIGAKLYSTNIDKIEEVNKLLADQLCDYLELKVVPKTKRFAQQWLEGLCGYSRIVLHAATVGDGFDPADPANKDLNFAYVMDDLLFWCDKLQASHVVTHAGMGNNLSEARHQLETLVPILRDNGVRLILENAPYYDLNHKRQVGAIMSEVSYLSRVGCDFCLDIGHAFATAAANDEQNYGCNLIFEFLCMMPEWYHIHDGRIGCEHDKHWNLGRGDYPIDKILSRYITRTGDQANITIETPLSRADFEYVKGVLSETH